MRLPDDVINYIFEYHNPLKEYYSKYILIELKIRKYQDYIKNRYGVDVFEKTQDDKDKANILAIKTIDNINVSIEEIKEIKENKKWFYDNVIKNIRRQIIRATDDEFIIAIITQIVLTQKRKRALDILTEYKNTECIN